MVKYSSKRATSTFRLITANKLIKLLKDGDNFNLKYVEALDYFSNELYSLGNYDEMQISTTEKQYDSFYKKANKLIDSIADMFEEKIERTIKAENIKDEIQRIKRSNYGRDTEAVVVLFMELAKNMNSEEVLQHPTNEIIYNVDAEESISVVGRTSTWRYTISGSTKTLDKIFKSKEITYKTETNRL